MSDAQVLGLHARPTPYAPSPSRVRDRLCFDQEWDNRFLDTIGLKQPVVTDHQESPNVRVITVFHPHPTYAECMRLWVKGNSSAKVSLLKSVEICATDLANLLLYTLLEKEESELQGRVLSAVGDQKILLWKKGKIEKLRQCGCQKCVSVFFVIPNASDEQVLSLHPEAGALPQIPGFARPVL